MLTEIPTAWQAMLPESEVEGTRLLERLEAERNRHRCFPPAGMEWRALEQLDPDSVKVILCGQDPYHGAGQAHGLAFSVAAGIPHPPSLRNILKELGQDLGRTWPMERDFDGSGVLSHWSREGVLLLNDVLTVREGQPGSHAKLGWQFFTGAILDGMAKRDQPLAILLWGRHAQAHAPRFHRPIHGVFSAPHPSPLSAHRGFFGSRPFSKANAWLTAHGAKPVDWFGAPA